MSTSKNVARVPALWGALLLAACVSHPVDITPPLDAGEPGPRTCPAPVTSATSPMCDASTTGLVAPKPACTSDNPCQPKTGGTLSTEINAPSPSLCHDTIVQWQDGNGELRWACVYKPPGLAPTAPRPLLIFFPGSFSNVDVLYTATGLRTKAETVDLTDDSSGPRPGFVVAAIQPRNLHDGNSLGDGQKFDYSYRDLGTDTCNPDVRASDTLIDSLASDGTIDPERIYVAGWSNGATFGQMYGIARNATPTPGGHQVAAAVAYAGGDPFNVSDSSDGCGLTTYPTSTIPIYSIHRSCDAVVPCDPAQAGAGNADLAVESWLTTLATQVHDPAGQDVIIGTDASTADACLPLGPGQCTAVAGLLNHLHWPDGSGSDSTDWEPSMLTFFRGHAHH